MVSSLIEEIRADAEGVGAGLIGEVVDDFVRVGRSAPVGEPESVPKEATPEMLTAGRWDRSAGACRLLFVNCPRVSFTMRGESVAMLLTATV